MLTLVAGELVTLAAAWPTNVAQPLNPPDPYVLRTEGQQRTAIGLVYTPELLAALVARQPAESLDPRIADAVRQETPIVVMWSVPVPPEVGPALPPYKITIVEHGDPTDPNGIKPVWIQKDATGLAQLDRRIRSKDVGAMAAFARAAFVPGRWICLYSDYPPEYEKRAQRGIRRWARIEWDGNQRLAKRDQEARIR